MDKTKTRGKIIIRKRQAVRFTGLVAAAKRLRVSVQAVSNYVSGRAPHSLSEKKRNLILIVEE